MSWMRRWVSCGPRAGPPPEDPGGDDDAELAGRDLICDRLADEVNTRAPAGQPGGRTGLERRLDGSGDELRGLRVDGDVLAEQHAADDLPGVPGRVLRAFGHVSPSLLR
jgi:hypothetical protein